MTLLACLLAAVLAGLAGIHVYWAGGGRWGASSAVPKQADGRALFRPSAAACLVVALGLGAFAYACLAHVVLVPPFFLAGKTTVVVFVISGLFALRTMGDFKFVGLFRRVDSTDFGRMDRIFYTPFCLLLSAALAWLAAGR